VGIEMFEWKEGLLGLLEEGKNVVGGSRGEGLIEKQKKLYRGGERMGYSEFEG